MPSLKESTISLAALLNGCTKDELHNIRRTLAVQNASQLNKKDLVECLMTYMIEHVEQHLERFDHNRYSVLKKVMEAPGSILPIMELADNEHYEPIYYQHYGFLFLMEDAVMMPLEIRERLRKVNAKRLKAILDRNTEWIQLTQGLLFYYGNMGVLNLKEKVEHYTGQAIDYFEFWRVVYDLVRYDFSIQYSESGFSHFMVGDPQSIEREHNSRPNLEYYPFTKAQVIRAAAEDYVERNEGYRQFVSFLRMHWEMEKEEADVITEDLVDRIKQGDAPSELVAIMQEIVDFSSMDQKHVEELLNVLMVLMNQTRLWELKGYRPNEMFEKEQKHLAPLPQPPIQAQPMIHSTPQKTSTSAVVYNFETKSKVGRNDPCPCGSGRKFKKCCGSS